MNISNSVEAVLPCPVCGAPTHVLYDGLYDDRYGYPDAFTLYECNSCGHLHMPTRFSSQDIGKLYTDFYPRGIFELDSFQPEREKSGFIAWLAGERGSAFRWVPRNVRVLDIGCGIGATLAYHMGRGCEAIGIEADGNVQPIAKRYGLDIRQGVFDGTQFESGYFDYVTLDQVAEHVADPNALLRGVARVLKPGGKVIITTPNPNSLGVSLYGRKWLHWHTPYHIQFYTRRSLKLAANQAGLNVVKTESRTASEWQWYQWVHVRQFPVRGKRSSFWAQGQVEPRKHWLFDKLIEEARRYRLHRWISRALDCLGLGDNRVYILQKP